MKNLVFIFLISFSSAQAQEFVNSLLVDIPGKNTNYDFLLTKYPDYPNETAFICFENYVNNTYSIILKQLAPSQSDYITIYANTLPQSNPTISFTSENDVRIIWQSRIDNKWQLLSRIYYPDSLSSVVQLTDELVDCKSPSLYYSYLCWIQGTDLNFGTVAESLHTINTIDNNSLNPEIMHEADFAPTTIDMVYEKTLDTSTLIKYAQYYDQNSTFETKVLSDSSTNINPRFGYSLDVSYQRFVNGFWKAVIADLYENNNEWVSDDKLFSIENPVYFTYPIPTKSENKEIRDFFLVYESDSISGNKEIILDFYSDWSNGPSINISNMSGNDINPYSTVMKDSVVIFWVNIIDENNSQIWWSKALFDPYSDIKDEESNSASIFTLSQNYPNPFNPKTNIPYYLNKQEMISIFIYDISGQKIKTLFSGIRQPGQHQEVWNGTNDFGIAVSSGLYYCILSLNDAKVSCKIVLLR